MVMTWSTHGMRFPTATTTVPTEIPMGSPMSAMNALAIR